MFISASRITELSARRHTKGCLMNTYPPGGSYVYTYLRGSIKIFLRSPLEQTVPPRPFNNTVFWFYVEPQRCCFPTTTQTALSVSSDLIEATLGHGLQQLVGFLGLVTGDDACRLRSQRLAAHQHHHIYCFLEEDDLRVLILERDK